MQRRRRRMRHQTWKIRRRSAQGNHEGLGIGRGDTERIDGLLARDDIGRVENHIDDLRVLRGGDRIHQAPEAGGEIFSHQRFAAGPAHVGSQLERVDTAVVADCPVLGSGRHRRCVLVETREAFEQIAQHHHRFVGARLVGIERVGIGAVASQQDGGLVSAGLVPLAAGAQCQRERRGENPASRDVRHQAARDFLRCTNRMDTAAGVTPATRAACPTVAGRICSSFCRTSLESPATRA